MIDLYRWWPHMRDVERRLRVQWHLEFCEALFRKMVAVDGRPSAVQDRA